MRYANLIAIALAANQAAAHALPSNNLESVAASSAEIQQERSTNDLGFLHRLLEKVGLNDNQVAQAKTVIHQESQENAVKAEEIVSVSKRDLASSGFLAKLLEKTGMSDNQIAQAKGVIVVESQQNEAKAADVEVDADVKVNAKRAADDSFVANLLAKVGLNKVQITQATDVIHQESQENKAKEAATISRRTAVDSFLSGILNKIGLNDVEKEQVQLAVEANLRQSKENKRTDVDENEQMRQQIAAEANLEQMQDATRPVPIQKDQLVQELKAWKAAPGTKRAYEELAAAHSALDKALGKRHILCV